MSEFAGKRVYITGAAGGIGRALCRAFGERGAAIGAIDRQESVRDFADDLRNDGIAAEAAVADIGDADQVAAAIDTLRAGPGPASVLVNNAGFSGASNLETTTDATWNSDIDTNLNGAYHCTARVLEDMKADRAGSIVTIGSVNGLSSFGDPAYSAAKAGLISYTKGLAMEYGRFGIRANIICPGTVRHADLGSKGQREPGHFRQPAEMVPAAAGFRSGGYRQRGLVSGQRRRRGDHRGRAAGGLRADGRKYRDVAGGHASRVLNSEWRRPGTKIEESRGNLHTKPAQDLAQSAADSAERGLITARNLIGVTRRILPSLRPAERCAAKAVLNGIEAAVRPAPRNQPRPRTSASRRQPGSAAQLDTKVCEIPNCVRRGARSPNQNRTASQPIRDCRLGPPSSVTRLTRSTWPNQGSDRLRRRRTSGMAQCQDAPDACARR